MKKILNKSKQNVKKDIKLEKKYSSVIHFQKFYNKGGIYNQFKVDLFKHIKKNKKNRIIVADSPSDDFFIYIYNEIDDFFVNCVKDIILSDKYINHLDTIKINLEIELDMQKNITGNEFSIDGIVSISLILSIFSILHNCLGLYTFSEIENIFDKLPSFKNLINKLDSFESINIKDLQNSLLGLFFLLLICSIALITTYNIAFGYKKRAIKNRRCYFQKKCILESIKIIEKEIVVKKSIT